MDLRIQVGNLLLIEAQLELLERDVNSLDDLEEVVLAERLRDVLE